MSLRIAVAGFQHETNTFASNQTRFEDFIKADSWPALLRGEDVLDGTKGINLPIAGMIEAASRQQDIDIVPILWCSAEPGGLVTRDAFDRITHMIIEGLASAGPLDGICLDLHGAMVTEDHDDGEGELLRRIRAVIGDELPVSCSLDLHANVTASMVKLASSMTIFRTYPHLDMADTGARCFDLLLEEIKHGPMTMAFRQAPFLIALPAQYTGAGPCRELYGKLEDLPLSADIALGFTAADIADAGPSIVVCGRDPEHCEVMAQSLLDDLIALEHTFDPELLAPKDAMQLAMTIDDPKPVVVADVQDNPGGGGSSDTTGLLHAAFECGVAGAVFGLFHDPALVAKAIEAGEGAVIEGHLGGRSGVEGDQPFLGRYRVSALRDGICPCGGEMYRGATAMLGPSVLLSVLDGRAEIAVIVTSERIQCLDRAMFTHFGIVPEAMRVIVVKSTVHFRADFQSIASSVLNAAAPGLLQCRLEHVAYQNLRSGMRLAATSDQKAKAP